MRTKEIVEFIEKKIKYHERHFNRYQKEAIKAREELDKSQENYSEKQAIITMRIMDELKEILKYINQQNSKTRKEVTE